MINWEAFVKSLSNQDFINLKQFVDGRIWHDSSLSLSQEEWAMPKVQAVKAVRNRLGISLSDTIVFVKQECQKASRSWEEWK